MNNKKRFYFLILIINVLLLVACSKGAKNYKNGMKAFEASEYELAASELNEAINQDPEEKAYYLAYADALIMLEEYEEAITYFEQAITDNDKKKNKENNKKAYYGLGISFYYMEQYNNAIEQFNKALSIEVLKKWDIDILEYKANAQLQLKLNIEAKDSLDTLIEMDDGVGEFYKKRASVYKDLGDLEKAIEDLDKAIELEPYNYAYYFDKYFILIELNQEDEAKVALQETVNIEIKNETDKYNSAKVNYYLGNYDAAFEVFTDTAKEGINESNYYLARIMEQEGKLEAAVTYYKELLLLPINEQDISSYYLALSYNQLGYSQLELKKFEEALSSFNIGLSLDEPLLKKALLKNKVIALESLGNYEEAYELLQEYTLLYPEDDEAIKELEFALTRLPQASPPVEE